MHALIDGDILVYRIAWTTENEDWPIAKWRTDEFFHKILEDTSADSFEIFLSDSTENSFRYQIYPAYKANRKQPKPKHYEQLKLYLVEQYDAFITSEQEADDALGIRQVEDTIICSIDKDLKQIPGLHYNLVTREVSEVSEYEGLLSFYTQLLIGDVVDNIQGLHRVGPVTAKKILKDSLTEDDMFSQCLEEYLSRGHQIEDLYLNGILLKIRTRENELWNFPPSFQEQQPKMEDLLSYSQMKAKENIHYSEPTSVENTGSPALGQ